MPLIDVTYDGTVGEEVLRDIEIRRAQDKQRRADLIRDHLSTLPLGRVGVWLILSEGAWSQN
jgi:hypothetical protein